jgi:hypothetical protein
MTKIEKSHTQRGVAPDEMFANLVSYLGIFAFICIINGADYVTYNSFL